MFSLTLTEWSASVPQSATFPIAKLKLPHCTYLGFFPNLCYINFSLPDFISLDRLACQDLFLVLMVF